MHFLKYCHKHSPNQVVFSDFTDEETKAQVGGVSFPIQKVLVHLTQNHTLSPKTGSVNRELPWLIFKQKVQQNTVAFKIMCASVSPGMCDKNAIFQSHLSVQDSHSDGATQNLVICISKYAQKCRNNKGYRSITYNLRITT